MIRLSVVARGVVGAVRGHNATPQQHGEAELAFLVFCDATKRPNAPFVRAGRIAAPLVPFLKLPSL
jgi:hypothetical protein